MPTTNTSESLFSTTSPALLLDTRSLASESGLMIPAGAGGVRKGGGRKGGGKGDPYHDRVVFVPSAVEQALQFNLVYISPWDGLDNAAVVVHPC
jgi:hypothetical protein